MQSTTWALGSRTPLMHGGAHEGSSLLRSRLERLWSARSLNSRHTTVSQRIHRSATTANRQSSRYSWKVLGARRKTLHPCRDIVFHQHDRCVSASSAAQEGQSQEEEDATKLASQTGSSLGSGSASAAQDAADETVAHAEDAAQQAVSTPSRWKRRWTIIALCFIAFMLCNMDRVNMSIAILPMAQQYGWDTATIGIVQSSFFWGYLLTQVLGGVWADKFGGKRVLSFGVIWWSMATALTPLAASLGLPVLLVMRACMGVGEGVAMPAMNNLLSRWVPVGERSRSLALVYSGMYSGSIMGLALSPHMVSRLQWPSVFYVFGFIGIFWFLAWEKNASSSPAVDNKISKEERDYITSQTIKQREDTKVPWKLILSKRPVWALILSHFCHNWGTFILLTWMPTYYNQVLGLDLMKSGIYSVLPWITMAIAANIGGWVADAMVQKGVSVTKVRKIMQSIGFLGPAFFLTQLSKVTSVGGAVACMMACQGLDACSQSGLYSNHQDIAPRYSGVLLGMSNTAGVLAGVLGTAATGMILQTGTWDDVWRVAIGLYLVGTVIWNLFSTGEQIID
ncbi:TPA: Sodium-dependent phosphate transport protein 1, chloroplastic [Trebouxia sp. C0006]